jgi:hypothetical protein
MFKGRIALNSSTISDANAMKKIKKSEPGVKNQQSGPNGVRLGCKEKPDDLQKYYLSQ